MRNLNRLVRLFLLASLILNAITISICYGQENQEENVNSYKPIDLKQDQFFVRYFKNFKNLVKNNDSKGLAKLFDNSYPKLLVVFDDKGAKPDNRKQIFIKNRGEFIQYYSRIFNKRTRALIASTLIEDLELMEGGIRLGTGQVWWYYYLKKKEIKVASLESCEEKLL